MIFVREISLAFALIVGLCATAHTQTPPAPPPGSQVPVGNSVISYIEVAPGTETKALAALKALKAASAKDAGLCLFHLASAHHPPQSFCADRDVVEGAMRRVRRIWRSRM